MNEVEEAIEANVTLVNGMQFVAETGSGHALIIDSRVDVGGSDSGPRPFELLAAGLAGCTAMDVISLMRKMQQKVTSLQVKVTSKRAKEHPKRFLEIYMEYILTGYSLAEDRVKRAIELSETKYCPAMASLRPGAPIKTSYKIIEASLDNLAK